MSQEGVDPIQVMPRYEEYVANIRAAWEAFNSGEFVTAIGYGTPDIELQDFPGLPDAEWHRGREVAGTWTGKLLQAFSGVRVELQEFRPIDADRLVVSGAFQIEGKRGGVRLTGGAAAIVTMRDGKVARMATFKDLGAALEAAGLAE